VYYYSLVSAIVKN